MRSGSGLVCVVLVGVFFRITEQQVFYDVRTERQSDSYGSRVVCYVTTSGYRRAGAFSFTSDHVDPLLCTHVIYAFASFGPKNTLQPLEEEFGTTSNFFFNITTLKKKNRNLKVMLSIGGPVEGTLGFRPITANDNNRREFTRNVVRYLRGYQFDGLDLFWQYPMWREINNKEIVHPIIPDRVDRENYARLAQTLRDEFEKEAVTYNRPRLLLSISITHNMHFLPAYDLASFNKYMDFISVTAYDYHQSFEENVAHHAPLYSLDDVGYDAIDNANYTVNYFSEFVDPKKLVLGIPMYGRSFRLADPERTTIGSPANGAGPRGPDTNETGLLSYFLICNLLNHEGWTVVQTKPGVAGPYAYKDRLWVGYDDLYMVRNKAKYVKQKGLGGVMFWSMDYDDYLGRCKDTNMRKFPLIRAARDELFNDKSVAYPAEPPPTQKAPDPPRRPVQTTTQKPPESQSSGPGSKVICYYNNWSYRRISEYVFTPDKLDPFLCTHIIYAFVFIGSRNNLIASDPEFDINQRAYLNITDFKKINKDLKVMVTIGGWYRFENGLKRITANDTNRQQFARNVIRYLRGYKFDGLDMNWDHSNFAELGGTPEDKEDYLLLSQTLREEFEKEAALKNKPRLLLSLVIPHKIRFTPPYELQKFAKFMDFISIIGYEYYYANWNVVNHQTPLYSYNDEIADTQNINYTINYFTSQIDPEKLVLGIPLYGRSYKLQDPRKTDFGSPANGLADESPILLLRKGFVAYFETCKYVNDDGWTVSQPKPGVTGPYAYKDRLWVCYDDVEMMRNKAKYVKQRGLGGVMFWTIDYDDALGKCADTEFNTFPLVRAARDALYDEPADEPDPPAFDPRPATPSYPTVRPALPTRPETEAAQPDTNLRDPVATRIPLTPEDPAQQPLPPPATVTDDDDHNHQDHHDPDLSQAGIFDELTRLIHKAGGIQNLLQHLPTNSQHQPKQSSNTPFEGEGPTIVWGTPGQHPLISITNTSVTIHNFFNGVSVYDKP